MQGPFERFWAGVAWHRSRNISKRPVAPRPTSSSIDDLPHGIHTLLIFDPGINLYTTKS
jgi:hypothetical protein